MAAVRRLPLGAWLTLLSLGLVLLVVAGLLPAALALFEKLAEENARSRVRLAALGAVDGVERQAQGALTAARLLAERPTLLRLLAAGETAELTAFLERFRATGGLDGCAVLRGGEPVAAAPAALPWAAIGGAGGDPAASVGGAGPAAGEPAGGRYLAPLGEDPAPLFVASAPLAGGAAGIAVVVRRLDAALAARLSQQVGLGVRIVVGPDADAASTSGSAGPGASAGAGGTAAREPGGARPTDLADPDSAGDHRARSGRLAAAAAGAFRARLPLGAGRLQVEAALPAGEVAAALRPLRRTFALVTIAAAGLAVGAGVLAGRRLARPLGALGRAAQRIGAGDLASPVPAAAGAEAAALAGAMEEMRRRLLALTADLRGSEAEAQALLTGIVEGVFAVDGERRIRYLNPQAAALLGLEPQAARGRFCGDVLVPRSADGGRPCETDCPIVHARSRGSSRAVEHLEPQPGRRRTVVITSAPPAGDRQVQVLRDETEEEGARRVRDAVLGNVSHELKTPLAAQLASIELLLDGLDRLGPEGARPLVQSLERSTLRLTRLIDNLLESVRIETGRASWSRVPVDLAAVAAEAAAATRPLLEQRDQRLEVDLPALPPVAGDPSQLTQVLVNLLANANKYAPAGSTIRIGGRADPGWPALWVEDQGPGVPPAASESVFDRFHRAGAGTGQDGMGLGLWIVKSIIARYGGRVAVAPGAGGGARFTVTLPAAVPAEEPA
jgi:signal transduction histidine kinase